jgi:HK97 family phage prohead protease
MATSLCHCSGYKCVRGGRVKGTSGRTVYGYAVRYDTDAGGDVIRRGAFRESLSDPWRARIWHLDAGDPIRRVGRPDVLEERAEGLYFETRIPQTSLGNQLLTLYKEGALSEHSVLMDEVQRDASGAITKARLWAVTSVTWSPQGAAGQAGVKALADTTRHLAALQRALDSGNLSPERTKEVAAHLGVDPPAEKTDPLAGWLAPRRYPLGHDPDRKHSVRRGW